MPAMTRLIGFRVILCATIAVVCALGRGAAQAETLRLSYDLYPDRFENMDDDKSPGFGVDVVKDVLAAMGQDASIEALPTNRLWIMIERGELEGMIATLPTSARARICAFPDEPLIHSRRILFIRTADIGKPKFATFDDLVRHSVAIREAVPDLPEQPVVASEPVKFLRAHHKIIEKDSVTEAFRMLAAGHFDYVAADLTYVMPRMGLAGKFGPLLLRSGIEGDLYVCFAKARVSPAFVGAFSLSLKQFKRTGRS